MNFLIRVEMHIYYNLQDFGYLCKSEEKCTGFHNIIG